MAGNFFLPETTLANPQGLVDNKFSNIQIIIRIEIFPKSVMCVNADVACKLLIMSDEDMMVC